MGLDLGAVRIRFRADTKHFDKGAKSVETRMGGLSKSALKLGAALGGAFALKQAGAFVWDTAQAASDLNETISKSGKVFLDSADAVDEWGDAAARNMGLSKAKAIEGAATLGTLLKGAGATDKKLAEMSTTMVQLAADMGSFNNVPTEDALLAIRSGLVGESEPLRKFGVLLNDARLKQEAMTMGLYEGKGPLTAQARMMAAYGLILKDTNLQQGDFQDTADGMANSLKTAAAAWEDAKAKMGEAWAPYIAQAAQWLTDHADDIADGIKTVTDGFIKGGNEADKWGREISYNLMGVEWDRIHAKADELEQTGELIGERLGRKVASSLTEAIGDQTSLQGIRGAFRDILGDMTTIPDEHVERFATAFVEQYVGVSEAKFGERDKQIRDAIIRLLTAEPDSAATETAIKYLSLLQETLDKNPLNVKVVVGGIGETYEPGTSTGTGIFAGSTWQTVAQLASLQEYAGGGLVPGPRGQATPIIAHAGERVLGERDTSDLSGTISAGNHLILAEMQGLRKDIQRTNRHLTNRVPAAQGGY